MMTALSLYSGGCDGLSLAASCVGIETAGFCECDQACREHIHRRHPGKPVFHYDTEVTRDALHENGIDPGSIGIVLASPPCQCASVAGKRLGAADQRNRWPECLRILRDVRPRWFLGENVPGLLSVDNGRLFSSILGELAEMGYDAGWCVYGARDIGAPHQRDRLCIVAHRNKGKFHRPLPTGNPPGGGGLTDSVFMVDPDHDGQFAAKKPGSADEGENDVSPRAVGPEQFAGPGRPQRGFMGDAEIERSQICIGKGETRQPRLECYGQDVGDARRGSLRQHRKDNGQAAGEVDKAAGTGALGNAERCGLPGYQRRWPGPEPEDGHFGGQGKDGRSWPAATGLGRLLTGVSRMVAAQRWPAGRGEPQDDWEPPRTVRGMKGRAAQLKMLGNAVVPQWAVVPLAVIVELEGSGNSI